MKTLEELAEFKVADLTTTLPKIILSAVETSARAKRFGRALVKINTDLVNKPGRSIHVPCRGSVTAAHVAEGCGVNPDEVKSAYATQEITPTKTAAMVRITQEAMDGSQYDLVKDHIFEAGEALAELEDTDIIKALTSWTASTQAGLAVNATAETFAIVGIALYATTMTGTTTGALTTKGLSISGGNMTIEVNEDLQSGETVTFVGAIAAVRQWACASNYVCAVVATTFGTLAYEDIVSAITNIRGQKWSPNMMLIHPSQMADLIKDNRFIDTSRYGARTPILNGEVGRIGGLTILTSVQMYEGVALIMDSTKAAYLVMKRNVDLKRWDNPSTDCTELYFWYEYAVGVTRPEAICVIVGAGTTLWA